MELYVFWKVKQKKEKRKCISSMMLMDLRCLISFSSAELWEHMPHYHLVEWGEALLLLVGYKAREMPSLRQRCRHSLPLMPFNAYYTHYIVNYMTKYINSGGNGNTQHSNTYLKLWTNACRGMAYWGTFREHYSRQLLTTSTRSGHKVISQIHSSNDEWLLAEDDYLSSECSTTHAFNMCLWLTV